MTKLKDLKIWQKMSLLKLVFIIPFVIVTWRVVASIDTLGVDFARQETRGLAYTGPLLALLNDLQQHRGLTVAMLSGDAAFADRLAAKSAEVDADLKAVDAADERLAAGLGLSGRWAGVSTACRALLVQPERVSLDEAFAHHTQVIGRLLGFIGEVADQSNLTLDPDVASNYLMHALVSQGPELTEYLGQARALGTRVAAGHGGPDLLERLTRLAGMTDYLQGKLKASLDKAFAANAELRAANATGLQPAVAAASEASALLGKLMATRGEGIGSSAYFTAMSRSIDGLFDAEQQIGASLGGLLDARIHRLSREKWITVLLAFAGMLGAILIGLLILSDITKPLDRVVTIANQIADGDLSMNVTPDRRRDEIGVLDRAFERMVAFLREMVYMAEQIAAGNLSVSIKPQSDHDLLGEALATMVRSLHELVGSVQKSGISVASSVNQIAATAKQQQATAGEIAATTMQIGATSREITATARELVKTVGEVSRVADESAQLAGSGQAGVTRMEDTMRLVVEAAGAINAKLAVLNDKASNISQVITTITKVADQTNLLSLNAAIEAEKAGEYGRGFSVVATEIRRLADQTAVATYDIEQMVKEIQSAVSAGVMGMDKFSEEVRRGMSDVQHVGGQLSQIIHQVQALAPRFEAVNEGMQAQSTGAEQITQALQQLNEAAQQTVESLRQSSQAIDGLNEVSGGLRGSVTRFKLREAA